MEIVIDASAIIAVIANEPEKTALIDLTNGVDLIAPFSLPWEICNAFSAMLKQKRITIEQAVQAVAIYQSIPLRLVEIELDEALKLADQLKIYAYDAYLIRCAAKYNTPLLSLDQKLLNQAKRVGVAVLEVNA